MAKIDQIISICQNSDKLELTLLIGSQSTGRATADSDWDIALQWRLDLDYMAQLAHTEELRHELSRVLGITDNKIDLINIPTAGLSMREQIANNGIILKGDNTRKLSHFLTKTWRELEEFYWDKIYAA